MTTPALSLRHVDLRQSSAYLLGAGTSLVLVDAGGDTTSEKLVARLREMGVRDGDLDLVVLTHGHPDHAGGAAAVREAFGAPIAIHAGDAGWVRAGRSVIENPRGFGRVLIRFLEPTFPAFEPDVVLHGDERLDDHGVPLTVVHTPGHTPGSISLLHPSGEALLGDLLAGGFLRTDRPQEPFFVDDRDENLASIAEVLEASPALARAHFGHGRPADRDSIRQLLADAR